MKTRTDKVQLLGIVATCLFFYIYTVGSVFERAEAYETMFIPVVAIAVIRLAFHASILKQYPRYYIWQAAFILLMGFSILYTINQRDPGAQWFVMLKILLKVSSVAIICGDFKGVKRMVWGLSICGAAVFITLLSTGHLYEDWRLGSDLMGNANSFGLLVTVFLTGALYYAVFPRSKYERVLQILIIALDVYMLFLSGGRKFLLYGIILLYGFLMMSNRQKRLSIVGPSILVGVAAFVGYLAIFNIPVLYDSIGIRFEGLGSNEGALGVNDQRSLMRFGLDMFLQRPIFGWGIAAFQQNYGATTGTFFYAHSNYIELLADYGFVGLSLFYSQYVYCFRVMWHNRKRDSEELCFYFPLLIAIMVIELFSITFNQTAFIPLFIMLISGFCYRLKKGYNVI